MVFISSFWIRLYQIRVLRLLNARVAKLVDARDLKSLGATPRAGSTPAPGTNKNNKLKNN